MTPRDTSFADFQRLVIADTALFDQLATVCAPDAFVAQAVRLGAERGLAFTADEVRAALQTARRAWIERHLL
jgi:hypothetical protein